MLEPKIIYENENVLAINKPAGLMIHGVGGKHFREGTQREEETLVDWIKENRPEIVGVGDKDLDGNLPQNDRPGIVHRLDRYTSGVMLIAKTNEYFQYLKSLFQSHQIKKTYLALVVGWPDEDEGIINKPIGIKDGSVKRTTFIKKAKMVREALTEYKVIRKFLFIEDDVEHKYALVELRPQTGRTHQIRVHLASIGHPVVGDELYGKKDERFSLNRYLLHADSIEFPKEEGDRVRFSADISDEFKEVLGKLTLSNLL
ncbi:MAG TPA: RluA family pseudouridine synthase [Candidatus Paceibacterota bacterium]